VINNKQWIKTLTGYAYFSMREIQGNIQREIAAAYYCSAFSDVI